MVKDEGNTITISTTIDKVTWKLAKENGIKWSQAISFGVNRLVGLYNGKTDNQQAVVINSNMNEMRSEITRLTTNIASLRKHLLAKGEEINKLKEELGVEHVS